MAHPPVLRQITEPVRAEDAVAVAPLAIDPLQPEDIDLGAAALESVDIDPISVHPLAVGPLTSDDMQ